MIEISNGIVNRPIKGCIYGPEGIGKTTLASKLPWPLFIDTEGGTERMDVQRFNRPESWEDIFTMINYLTKNTVLCKTLVIDTADWAEQLAVAYLLEKNDWASIETPGYGKGYQYIGEEFARLLKTLNQITAAGINVFFVAHAKMRKFEQPDEMGAYDRWETKLSKQVAPLIKEWCDILLFCNYQTFVVKGESKTDKAKATGGKRVMYATHHPCWDAKNRFGLPDVMDMDYKNIAHIFTNAGSKQAVNSTTQNIQAVRPLVKQVQDMMTQSGIADADLRAFIASRKYYPEETPIDEYEDRFLSGWVIKWWDSIVKMIKNDSNKEANKDGDK